MALHQVQFVAVTFDDGSVGIMQFILDPNLPPGVSIPGYDPATKLREATDAAIQYEINKSVWTPRTPVSFRRITELELAPLDRAYRNAWTDSGGALAHDLPKARALHRNKMRAARTPLLATLDADYLQADERGDTTAKTSIATQKQQLRDVTADPAIDAAATIAQLKAVWPAVLGPNGTRVSSG